VLHVLLGIIVVESATNKSLAGVQGIFRVLYGLDIIFKNKKEEVGASEEHRALLRQRRVGKMLTCRLATSPTKRVPSSVTATTEGVVRWPKRSVGDILPSAFSMTLGLPDSITATQELVVPRSIPTMLKL